jgi:hypothetical protein
VVAGLLPAPVLLFACVLSVWRTLQAQTRWLPIGVYCAIGLMTTVTAGKSGADVNYLFEAATGSCAALGLLYAARGHSEGRLTATGVIILAQIGILCASYLAFGRTVRFAVVADMPRLEQILRSAEGPVICDVGLGVLPLMGRHVYLDPFATKQLADTGHWNDTRLVRETLEGRFAVIVQAQRPDLVGSRWTPDMRRAIAQRYRETDRIKVGVGATQPLYASVLRPIPVAPSTPGSATMPSPARATAPAAPRSKRMQS